MSIAQKAIEAVGNEWVGRGPATVLSRELLREHRLESLDLLVEHISTGAIVVKPGFAQVVLEQALRGDHVANRIVAWAAQELGKLVGAVERQFEDDGTAIDVVAAGTLLQRASPLHSELRSVLASQVPRGRVVALGVSAALGAASVTPGAANTSIRREMLKSFRSLVGS